MCADALYEYGYRYVVILCLSGVCLSVETDVCWYNV